MGRIKVSFGRTIGGRSGAFESTRLDIGVEEDFEGSRDVAARRLLAWCRGLVQNVETEIIKEQNRGSKNGRSR